MPRSIIIHGHFYQPPRENPWTHTIESTDLTLGSSIENFNRQIDLQCYTPNSLAYVYKNGQMEVVNNYAYMSFNFGPTLQTWLKDNNFSTYQRIIQGDYDSQEKQNGHGNAIAQVYNHAILPLASREDKITQIRWGKIAFRKTFDREAEGIWLAEAAVDDETISCLIEEGMKFAVLPARAVKRMRLVGTESWTGIAGSAATTSLCQVTKGGKSLSIFIIDPYYYDHIGGMLKDVNVFIDDFNRRYPEDGTEKVISICTDGELYGHWESYGERFLAYLFTEIFPQHGIQVTNFANYASQHQAQYEIEVQVASWSCIHGVERWKSNCGCSDEQSGSQEYRAPLREAINFLSKRLLEIYLEQTTPFFTDPIQARYELLEYNQNDDASRHLFIKNYLKPEKMPLSFGVEHALLNLLKSQYYAQLMLTSCGWFFYSLTRIEPIKILQYAAKAIEHLQLPSLIEKTENEFLQILEKASVYDYPLNGVANGKDLYLAETRYRAPKSSDKFELIHQPFNQQLIIKPPKDLVAEHSEQFTWELAHIARGHLWHNIKTVLIDFNTVTEVDNNAIASLLAFLPIVKNLGIKLKVSCDRKSTIELLNISRVPEIEIIYVP